MNMKKIIFTIALTCFITSNAQNVTTNGTILLDDATSRTRVVVDAFLNSSNQIHSLIESIGISGGLTTNDVCNIVTNDVSFYSDWRVYTTNDVLYENITLAWFDEESDWILMDDNVALAGVGGEIDSVRIDIRIDSLPFYGYAVRSLESRNALGLARLSDIAPTISNTVTKAYVDDLGIEIGVDAQTVTNMTALTPVYKGDKYSAWDITPKNYDGYPIVLRLVYYPEDGGAYLWAPTANGTDIGSPIGNLNSTNLTWTTDFAIMPITATRTANPIIGYTLGNQTNSVLASTNGIVSASTATNISFAVSADATNSLHKSLAPTITNIASTVSSSAIASADTTYRRTIGLTNLNQSVQYVNITDITPSTLEITMPTDGATKDWMVYVVSVTNVTLSLPSATWWMADTAYTNDVPPATPTALWFSQVTDGIFILGRQELTEVTAP